MAIPLQRAAASTVREQQLRRACAEIDRRLRAGEDCRSEEILAASPDLAADSESTLELVYTEFAVRDELGMKPSPEAWYARFPSIRSELQALFEVHQCVCDTALIQSAGSVADQPAVVNPATAVDGRPRLTVGPHEILCEIGRGGMGVVYQARRLGLNRIVAVKMLLGIDHATPQQVQRFRDECEAVARLQHPNIVQIFEMGEQDGHPYFSLEFVDGGGLDQLLARSLPTSREAAQLVETLAMAIGYAHERGIVHRDLKPANVLLQRTIPLRKPVETELPATLSESVPKITDFGLAKQLAETDAGQTRSGTIIGTPGYMAPEQADGRKHQIGPAADIHALGAILYEMLVGKPPFQADALWETLERVRTRQPSFPAEFQWRVPRDLQTICLKCLEKEPSQRYRTAQSLAEDLRRFLNHETILARRADSVERFARWCRRKPLVASLMGALIIALFLGVVGVTGQWRRAERLAEVALEHRDAAKVERNVAISERKRAEENLQRARGVVDRLTRLAQDLADQPHMEDVRRAALEETISFYEGFLADNGDDPQLQLEAGLAHVRVAYLQDQLGQQQLAEATLANGHRLLSQIPGGYAARPECRLELARCLNQMGHVRRHQGRFPEAETSYVESIGILQELLAVHPEDMDCQALLANTLCNRAAGMQSLARIDEAEKLCREGLQLQADVVRRRPRDAWAQTELALIQDSLGLILRRERRLTESLEMCREALATRTQVATAAPSVSIYRQNLGQSHQNLGEVLRRLGRFDEAIVSYREALRLRKQLVSDFPRNALYRDHLAASCRGLGYRLLKAGNSTESIETFRLGLEATPNDARMLNELAWSLVTCADPAFRNPAEAIELARRATEIAPEAPDYWNTLGVASYRLGDAQAAVNSLKRAIEIRRAGGTCIDWLFLAMAYRQSDQADAAHFWHRQAVEWLDQQPGPPDAELLRVRGEADALMATGN